MSEPLTPEELLKEHCAGQIGLHEWANCNLALKSAALNAIRAAEERGRLAGWEQARKLKEALMKWVGDTRAASNIMSIADGDGPYQEAYRLCAKQIEKIVAALKPEPAKPAELEDEPA